MFLNPSSQKKIDGAEELYFERAYDLPEQA